MIENVAGIDAVRRRILLHASQYDRFADGRTPGTNETYRLLINGTVVAAASGPSGHTFQLNEFFNPGTCIQGGVLGLPDARTPCWTVP